MAVLVWTVAGRAGAPQAPVRNKAGCVSLTGLAIPAASIGLPTSGAAIGAAELVAATPQTVSGDRAILAIPQYCKVTGSIAPVDPAAPNDQLSRQPAGGVEPEAGAVGRQRQQRRDPGGADDRHAVGPESIPPNAPYALSRGFVVYGSDSGHQTALAERRRRRGGDGRTAAT